MLKGVSTIARTVQKASVPLVDIIPFREKCMASSAARAIVPNDDAADTSGPGSKSPEEKEYHVLKRLALNKLHLNMENVPVSLQGPFVDFYLKDLQTEIEENELLRISFNFVNEEVFRYNLNMAVRKLGFKSYFSRYNHGEGVAVFERV